MQTGNPKNRISGIFCRTQTTRKSLKSPPIPYFPENFSERAASLNRQKPVVSLYQRKGGLATSQDFKLIPFAMYVYQLFLHLSLDSHHRLKVGHKF